MLRSLLFPLAAMMMFVSLPAEAGPFRVFGPWHHPQGETRERVSETFVATRAAATYAVRLFSAGDSGQFQALSNVTVTLNGEEIFGPRDFVKVSLLEKAVKLRRDNVITIESRGDKVGLTILIVGIDEGHQAVNAGLVSVPDNQTVSATAKDKAGLVRIKSTAQARSFTPQRFAAARNGWPREANGSLRRIAASR